MRSPVTILLIPSTAQIVENAQQLPSIYDQHWTVNIQSDFFLIFKQLRFFVVLEEISGVGSAKPANEEYLAWLGNKILLSDFLPFIQPIISGEPTLSLNQKLPSLKILSC